jgi:preprotein translocase SecE subunit
MSFESHPQSEGVNETLVAMNQGQSQGRIRLSGAVKFFGEVKQEMRRISWTSGKELRASTKIVLIALLVSGFATYAVDLILQGGIASLNAIARWIAS